MNTRTEAAKEYEKALMFHLNKYQYGALNFLAAFDPKTQHLHAEWEISSPEVLTKAGAYSRNGTDLDAHKVLQDVIMKFIGIDDAFIVKDTRIKLHGDYAIKLTLTVHENNGADLL